MTYTMGVILIVSATIIAVMLLIFSLAMIDGDGSLFFFISLFIIIPFQCEQL